LGTPRNSEGWKFPEFRSRYQKDTQINGKTDPKLSLFSPNFTKFSRNFAKFCEILRNFREISRPKNESVFPLIHVSFWVQKKVSRRDFGRNFAQLFVSRSAAENCAKNTLFLTQKDTQINGKTGSISDPNFREIFAKFREISPNFREISRNFAKFREIFAKNSSFFAQKKIRGLMGKAYFFHAKNTQISRCTKFRQISRNFAKFRQISPNFRFKKIRKSAVKPIFFRVRNFRRNFAKFREISRNFAKF